MAGLLGQAASRLDWYGKEIKVDRVGWEKNKMELVKARDFRKLSEINCLGPALHHVLSPHL